MRDLEASLAEIRSAWMTGRSALGHCPAAWREAVDGPDAELALAALVGHATGVLTRQAPEGGLAVRPLLPVLPAPLVPAALRPRVRRLLARHKGEASLERPLVELVTARGFALHPDDWMPGPRDDWAPDLYAPWLDWLRAEARAEPAAELTIDSYDQWPWAERRVALAALRAKDPAAARAIIGAKARTEPAERRLRLIEILDDRLSEADADTLEGFAGDRSDRVQALSRALLGRLGRASETDALAAELAPLVSLGSTGFLNRRRRLSLGTLKTGPQQARRRELLRLASLAGLARALGVGEAQLVESVPEGAAEDLEAFVQMVAATGSEAACRTLLGLLLQDATVPPLLARPLAPRLSAEARRALLDRAIERDGEGFETTLALMGGMLGEAPLSAFTAAPAYAALRAALGEGPDRQQASKTLDIGVSRIGLLLDAAGAGALAAHLVAWGLPQPDPRLDMLRLNAALIPETTV